MKIPRATCRRKTLAINSVGSVQKSPSSKAAVIFARGAYGHYVSTEKWRERRWRLFSTDPSCEVDNPLDKVIDMWRNS